MKSFAHQLMLGGSTLAFVAITVTSALAQGDRSVDPVETVTVTGTSIRGIAPIGSNLVSVDQASIKQTGAQTLQQVFATVPALTGMGMIGQGQTNNSFLQPTIHQLGGSSSNATMVIIDGHRSPTGSTNHTNQVDPGIIPFNMIQRVEILPDGSSSIYGSDALTGVINLITRDSFEGIQLSAQVGTMSGATDKTFGFLAGTGLGKGSVMFAATHANLGALRFDSRPQTYPNHISQSGTNFRSFNCSPASIQPNGAGNIYLSVTAPTSLVNTTPNSPCTDWSYRDIMPNTVRNNAMMKGRMEIAANLTLTADLLYSSYRDTSIISRGLITATAFGGPGYVGTQGNPFYINPTGIATTKQTIRWDANQLLGPGAFSQSGTDALYSSVNAEYRINDNWILNVLANAGTSTSINNTDGTVNASVANLALNGTTLSSGSLVTPSILGTTTIITGLPLTASKALDVWNPSSSNLTSAAVRSALVNNAARLSAMAGYQQVRAGVNGSLFELPAGPVKVSAGGEGYNTQLTQHSANANSTGPATAGSQQGNLRYRQNVVSAYGEFAIPVIGPGMAIPLVKKLDLAISGRWDNYDTVGVTKNHKLSFDLVVIDGLKLRGSMSTSFSAPIIDGRGTLENGVYTGYNLGNSFGGTTNNGNVPIALYPLVAQLGIPGCTAVSVTCNISTIQGIIRSSGDANIQPQKGHGWTLGFDYAPDFLLGFLSQFTFWSTTMIGGVTAPNFNNVINTPSLTRLLTFFPGCATSAQITAFQGPIPLTAALPACAQYLQFRPNTNMLDLKPQGIDASFSYMFDLETYGTFKLGDTLSLFTRYDEAFGGGKNYSVLGTTGANGSFPSVAIQSRANLGWIYEKFTADLFLNYTSAYRNWNGSSVIPIVTDANFNPAGGGDHVNAHITFDLNMSYNLDIKNWGEHEVSVTARNLFNQAPPFYNSSGGWDTWVANPLGRIITIGLTTKL